MGCNDKVKDTCGKKINAKCVDYEGDLHANTLIEECSKPSVEDVLEDVALELNAINEAIDLSGLEDTCIEYKETDGKILIKDAISALATKVCKVAEYVGMPNAGCTTCDNCSPVFGEEIACLNLDLGTLVDACGTPPTTLTELLQVMLNEINNN